MEAFSLMQDIFFFSLFNFVLGCLGNYQEEPVLPVRACFALREIYGDLTLEHQSLYLLQPTCSSVMDVNTPEAGTPDRLTSQLLYGS